MSSPVQTWSHQAGGIEYLIEHQNAALVAHMGSGKSRMLIEAIRVKGVVGTKKTLIICPSAVRGVWNGQFLKHAPGQFDVVICDSKSSIENSKRIIEGFNRRQAGGLPLVIVINLDQFWRPTILPLLSGAMWEVMAADELHRLKGYSTKCSMNAWHLGKRAASRIGLTGTLMPNSPLDVFGQYRFLQETIFGRYITHFRNRYAIANKYIPQKIDKWVNQEEMTQKIQLIQYRISKDVLVLPDKQDIIIHVPLSPAGMKIYKEMRKDAIAMIRRSKEDGGVETKTAIASNGAVKFLRLLQLAQGYVGDENKEEIDTDTQKRKGLLDLLEDSMGEPVICYGWFHHDLKCVEDCCRILGLRYGELSCRPGRPRSCLNEYSEMADDLDVAGVQCASGGTGINLTRSSIGIFMNTGMLSPGSYDQLLARQCRPGQTKNMRYYHLITPGTIDETIVKARADKKDVIDAILDSEEFF